MREKNRTEGASRKGMRALLPLILTTIAACAGSTPCEQLRDLALPAGTLAAENVLDPGGPSYCRVSITSVPVPDSEIHSEVWLPAPEKWNGKLLGTGNGGYSSQMDLRSMRTGLLQGMR